MVPDLIASRVPGLSGQRLTLCIGQFTLGLPSPLARAPWRNLHPRPGAPSGLCTEDSPPPFEVRSLRSEFLKQNNAEAGYPDVIFHDFLTPHLGQPITHIARSQRKIVVLSSLNLDHSWLTVTSSGAIGRWSFGESEKPT